MNRPRLHADILDNDSAVMSLVDAMFEHHAEHAKLSRRILAKQQRLQEVVGKDAWLLVLDVEQLVNERVNVMLAVTARWAFNEGRRSRRGAR